MPPNVFILPGGINILYCLLSLLQSGTFSVRHHPVRKPRPVSDDMTEKAPVTSHRRLSNISEERARRKSLPAEVLQGQLAQFHKSRHDPLSK